jgi:hypothetical protein
MLEIELDLRLVPCSVRPCCVSSSPNVVDAHLGALTARTTTLSLVVCISERGVVIVAGSSWQRELSSAQLTADGCRVWICCSRMRALSARLPGPSSPETWARVSASRMLRIDPLVALLASIVSLRVIVFIERTDQTRSRLSRVQTHPPRLKSSYARQRQRAIMRHPMRSQPAASSWP